MSCWGENVFHQGFSCVRCAYAGDQLAATRTKTVMENLRTAAGISSSVALSMAGTTSQSALSGWSERRRARAQREPLDSCSIHSTAMAKKRKRPDRLLDRALSGVLGGNSIAPCVVQVPVRSRTLVFRRFFRSSLARHAAKLQAPACEPAW